MEILRGALSQVRVQSLEPDWSDRNTSLRKVEAPLPVTLPRQEWRGEPGEGASIKEHRETMNLIVGADPAVGQVTAHTAFVYVLGLELL